VKLVFDHSQSFLIGRPADRGTKLLTKHESAPLCRFPGHPGGVPIGVFLITPFANSVDKITLSRDRSPRLPSVNLNRKGLRPQRPKQHRRVSGATKAGIRSNPTAMIARVKSGNGEQAWL
jgi:hypothetical protein